MRFQLVAAWLLLSLPTSALAQVSIQFDLPGVSIGINQPAYPQLVQVPGYPVYYDPRADSNYFFYDGLYWVYQGDSWYSSAWYDGPWALMVPQAVPLFILRVPVSYYRRPPSYFHGWRGDAPPRWGEHWGRSWEQEHGGWDRWDRREAPPPAPLPVYQRQYSGKSYPAPEQQGALRARNYRYEPRDAAVKQLTHGMGTAAPSPQAQPGHAAERGQPARENRQPSEPARSPAAPVAQPHAQPAQQQEHAQPPARQHAQPAQQQEHAQPPARQHAQPAQQQERAQPPAQQQHAQPAQQQERAQPPAQQQHAQPAPQQQRPAAQEKGGQRGSKGEPGQKRGDERGEERGGERGGEHGK